jgi:hypothetical protein
MIPDSSGFAHLRLPVAGWLRPWLAGGRPAARTVGRITVWPYVTERRLPGDEVATRTRRGCHEQKTASVTPVAAQARCV